MLANENIEEFEIIFDSLAKWKYFVPGNPL